MHFFKKLLGRYKIKADGYENKKFIAVEGKPKQRLSLAKNSKTPKEILYYLAEYDPDEKVRQAVAKNKSTPLHAAAILAIDKNVDVRLSLAERLVKLLPDLTTDTHSQLYAFAVQALGTLALDEVLKIRKSLTSTLKDHAYAPPAVAAQLARDLEREVSEPILRFCTALQDEDLINILASHPKAWAAEAVARRKVISAKVSKAVIETGNAVAGKLLLENKGANITTDVLEVVIQRAREFPEWHEPIATRHKLSEDMARQLAHYVDARIRKILEKQGEYDLQTTEVVTDTTRRRINLANELEGERQENDQGEADDLDQTMKRVYILFTDNKLTEDVILDHLALRDKDFLIAALACLTGVNISKINKVFSIKKPQMICAICWKAGLSMRFALRVQQEVANVPPKELLYPRGGTDYPLKEKDMQWQLEFLGIE